MLTSKEIIERTGISRATLNNYIASGLVPRPQVLPPGPEDGAAPRIGYFPDDTIDRIEAIQRLKREGWSIARIAEQLARAGTPAPNPAAAPAPAIPAAPAQQDLGLPPPRLSNPPAPLPPAAIPSGGSAVSNVLPTLTLPLHQIQHPAYVLDDRFSLVWSNEAARAGVLSSLRPGGNALAALLPAADDEAGATVLRLHLRVARARALAAGALTGGLSAADANRVEDLLAQETRPEPRPVFHAVVPASAAGPARQLVAVQFREGVLFTSLPQDRASAPAAASSETAQPAAAPRVVPVAVLVGNLQDAAGLWVKLSAQEYFELVNEVWTELDRILRRHRASTGRVTGELLVCYFLPAADDSYLWNALAAAHQTREAMRQLSHRWQLRKGWDLDLCVNMGIAEGQEWMGAVGAGTVAELRVLGDAADHAEHLAAASRAGAILVTRSLLGKLPGDERQRVSYGVSRRDAGRGEAPLLFTFARLEEIAGPRSAPPHLAGLPVAELLDLTPPIPPTGAHTAG